jgi:DNA-binding transcriptional LysR family regulator
MSETDYCVNNAFAETASMDTSKIEIFMDVMTHGSFTAAAKLRDQDPSSISRAISSLERELGFRLFQRTTRRLVSTEAGAAYFERVRPLFEAIQAVTMETLDMSTAPRGTLRITAPISFGQIWLAPRLPAFAKAYPDLTVDFMLDDTTLDLISEKIDVAIRVGPRPETTFIASRIIDLEYRVYASPSYIQAFGLPENPQDLESRNCLLFRLPGYRSNWQFRLKGQPPVNVSVSGKLLSSNAFILYSAALDGLGVTLLPRWMIHEDVQKGRLVDLFPNHEISARDFGAGIWVIYPSRSYVPRKVRAFVSFIKSQIR